MRARPAVAGAAAALLLVALAAAAGGQDAGPATGVVAVLRRDGLLLPFARFKGSGWKAPWPGSSRNQTIPLNLEAVPESWWGGAAPAAWQAWLLDGTHRAIEPRAPQTYRSGCDIRIGLRSRYEPAEPPPVPPVEPFPKDGLAVSDGAALAPIERVDPARAGGARFLEVLGPELNRVEDSQLRRIGRATGWRHPVDAGVRHDMPLRLESWYRAPNGEGGATVSYVEIVRAYDARPEDNGCGLETFFSGWVLEDPRRDRLETELNARPTYCDRDAVLYMLPFGRLTAGGRHFWIYQLSGWDEEWYNVTRIDDRRVHAEVEFYGGGSATCLPAIRR